MNVVPRGCFFIYVIFVTCFSTFFPFALIPAALLGSARVILGTQPVFLTWLFNVFYNFIQHMFIALMSILIECVLHVRLAYTVVSKRKTAPKKNDAASPNLADVFTPPKPGKFKIIFLNHRTRLDWMMLFPFFARTSMMPSLRIVLKNELSCVPVFGWSTQFFRYIFLTRKWSNDEESMRQMIEYYKRTNDGGMIVIFPEGTDLSESSVVKSQAYATQNGLPLFHYVLNPRATGFVSLVNMIGIQNIEELIDVTMGYTDYEIGERPSEVSIVNGRMPRKIHILCSRHPFPNTAFADKNDGGLLMDAPPSDAVRLREWMNDRFAIKELLLSHFYGSNPVSFEAHHVKSVFGEDTEVVSYDEDEDAARNAKSTKFSRFIHGVGIWRGFIGVVAFWTVPVLLWLWYVTLGKVLLSALCFLACYWLNRSKGSLQNWLLFSDVKKGIASKRD